MSRHLSMATSFTVSSFKLSSTVSLVVTIKLTKGYGGPEVNNINHSGTESSLYMLILQMLNVTALCSLIFIQQVTKRHLKWEKGLWCLTPLSTIFKLYLTLCTLSFEINENRLSDTRCLIQDVVSPHCGDKRMARRCTRRSLPN
jgi:hypothetical protein